MAATVAALALAAAAAGAGTYTATETTKAAKEANKKKGKVLGRVPPPAFIAALQRMTARTLAANQGAAPPSFGEFTRSGGTAKFPLNFTAPTPQEAMALGFVGPENQEVPFFNVDKQTSLTPEQLLFSLQSALGQKVSGPKSQKYDKTRAREEMLYGQLSRGFYSPRKERELSRQLANTQKRRRNLEVGLFPDIDLATLLGYEAREQSGGG